jgi:putative inorganic carbon (HCO3(-)) transporter
MTATNIASRFPRWRPVPAETAPLSSSSEMRTGKPPVSYWLLLAFLILLYANLPFVLPASEVFRPAMIIAVFGVLAVLRETLYGGRTFEFAFPEGALLIAFLGAAGLSCFGALWPQFAADGVITLLKMAVVYFVIVNSAITERTLQGVMATMVVCGLFPALGTIRNYAQGNIVEGRTSWVGIFANPNEVAYSLVILLPLAAYLISVRRGWTRIALIVISLVFIPAIYVTFSRGGLIGLAAVAILYSWRKRIVWLQLLMIALVVVGSLAASRFWSRDEDFSQLNTDVSFQQRLATSQAGFDMFIDHPLLGVGLACSVIAWPLYAPPELYTRGALVTHNTIIQTLSETGILGFVPFMLLIGVGLFHMRTLGRSPDKPIASMGTAIEVGLWGLVVCGMSGGYVVTWFPYLLLGLAGAARRMARENAEEAQ